MRQPLRFLDSPDPANPPRHYYVTCVDAGRAGVLAGPYDTHAEALAIKPVVQEMAMGANPWAHFFAFGTAGSDDVLKTVFGKVDNQPRPSVQQPIEREPLARRQGRLAL